VGPAVPKLDPQAEIERIYGFRPSEAYIDESKNPNGYYTWPRLGFDKRLTSQEQAHLSPELAHVTFLSEIMEQPKGRHWWREHGFALEVTFDLTPQSRSMQILEAARKRLDNEDGYWDSGPDMPLRIRREASLRTRNWQERNWKYRQL